MQKKEKSKHYHITSFQIIILGFLSVILIGSLLLMLPIATRSGNSTSFSDALFTATSAVCVTGLIIHDTATYWSVFGQGIILLLIQIGGMGIVKIGLMQRSTMQEAIAAPNVGGIVRRTKFILKTAIFVELIGAAILLCYKVISARIPLTYIGSFAVFIIIYMLVSQKGFDVNYLFTHLCGGGLMLGAWFMATDYVTSPITPKGQYVYGVCLGVLTGIFRIFGASAEGVSYAIIFCNLLVPQIERFTRPVAFGKGGAKK